MKMQLLYKCEVSHHVYYVIHFTIVLFDYDYYYYFCYYCCFSLYRILVQPILYTRYYFSFKHFFHRITYYYRQIFVMHLLRSSAAVNGKHSTELFCCGVFQRSRHEYVFLMHATSTFNNNIYFCHQIIFHIHKLLQVLVVVCDDVRVRYHGFLLCVVCGL